MKLIAARAGGDTDTSSDHEYTDWHNVRRFAGACAAQMQAVRGAADRSSASNDRQPGP